MLFVFLAASINSNNVVSNLRVLIMAGNDSLQLLHGRLMSPIGVSELSLIMILGLSLL